MSAEIPSSRKCPVQDVFNRRCNDMSSQWERGEVHCGEVEVTAGEFVLQAGLSASMVSMGLPGVVCFHR